MIWAPVSRPNRCGVNAAICSALSKAICGAVAIAEEGQIVGMISVRDLLRYFKNWGGL